MENLKEIDLLLMAVPEDIHDNAWVQTAIKMLRDIAEITKKNEPVGYFEQEYIGGPVLFYQVNYSEKEKIGVVPLYSFPPSTEQIENRVAEACAELCDSLYITENAAYEIRAGKWKDYLK